MLSTTQHKVRVAANTRSFIQPWTLLLAVLLNLSAGIAMGDSIDDDGDGFCDDPIACTDGSSPGDCDDTDAQFYLLQTWFYDCDGDDHYQVVDDVCNPSNDTSTCTDSMVPDEFSLTTADFIGLDCDDSDAQATTETQDWFYDCDGDDHYQVVDDVCNPSNDVSTCTDSMVPDEFSLTTADFIGPDCDDNDPFRSPVAAEICDGIDNNCDGVIDEGCGSYDLYGCGGATFEDGYTAHVILEAPWMGVAFQAEDDVDGTCKDKKTDGFACTRSGNLITARIDDAAIFRDFADSIDNYTLDLAVSAAGDPAYATVYADIFDPGDCASPFACNYDGVDQGGESVLADDTCYDSGFGGGGSADGNGYFDSAAASCAATFENTSEGAFAQGEPFSPDWSNNGGPSKGNWAMYVELHAACQGGLVSVPTGSTPPTCDSAAVTVDAIADGGDFDMDYIDAGDVTFAPDTDCAAELECEDSLSPTACVFDD